MANPYDNASEFINRKTGGNDGRPQLITQIKSWRYFGGGASVPVLGRMYSMWLHDGNPGAGEIPTTAHAPSRTTPGAIPFAAPTVGSKYIDWFHGYASIVGGWALYDRLYHTSGLSAANTGVQTVNTGALTRNTGGDTNVIFVEIYALLGATLSSATISYTNQAGVAGRTAYIDFIGSAQYRNIGTIIQARLQDGDTGVRSVETVQLASTTGGAGDFGITIAKPLVPFIAGATSGQAGSKTFVDGSLVAIDDNACLWPVWYAGSTTTPNSMLVQFSMTER